jgi:1,4-dihydroxy-2-naphthoate octaprenyltransferase
MRVSVAVVLVGVLCAGICGFLAPRRNRSPLGWVFLGFCFGLFAVAAVAFLPTLDETPAASDEKRPTLFGTG